MFLLVVGMSFVIFLTQTVIDFVCLRRKLQGCAFDAVHVRVANSRVFDNPSRARRSYSIKGLLSHARELTTGRGRDEGWAWRALGSKTDIRLDIQRNVVTRIWHPEKSLFLFISVVIFHSLSSYIPALCVCVFLFFFFLSLSIPLCVSALVGRAFPPVSLGHTCWMAILNVATQRCQEGLAQS